MRMTEIKVGTDYAYSHSSYGIPSRVTVLETGVERKEGWGTTAKTVKNGVRVRWSNGGDGIVASREIREEWAPYSERLESNAQARREAQARAATDRFERARQAKVLDDYLAGHGEEALPRVVFGLEREALVAAGFEVAPAEGQPGPLVLSRIGSIRDFVANGKVNVADLGPVLADLAHRLPKEVA